MLLALAAVSAVLFALPAVASAAEWTLEPGNQNFSASSVGGTTLTTNANEEEVNCTGSTGNGTVNAAGTGGTIELTFTGCKSLGTNCTTAGKTAGTITTTTMDWTSVYLTHNKTTPGIKLEGTTEGAKHGHIATFKCGFGLVTIEVEGSVIGHVEEECDEKVRKEFLINFESVERGVQKYMQNTATGTKTDLTAWRNGAHRTASQDGTGKITLEKESTIHCV